MKNEWLKYFEIGHYAVWRKFVDGRYIYRMDNAFDGKPSEDCGGWNKLSEILKRKEL